MAFISFGADLTLNIQNFTSNLKKASEQMAKFAASSVRTGATANTTFSQYGKQISEATSVLGKHNLGLKDTARIVQGILISQAFYQAAGAIREAASALWSFNESLDYASVTYAGLFGSQELSDSFLVALREQAEETIFTFEQLADSSKKLLAYGIPYNNLMFISEGLMNLGAMSGDAAALDRIALALGQIYAKGKLSGEEMRQLANAYVPIQQIIQDKFGLSEDDMGRVGDLNLPAADVINAVVDYANENFGAVGDAAMFTIRGLKNKIVDSLKNLGVDILQPLTVVYKSFLAFIANSISEIGDAFDSGGLKGVFEKLVPNPETQERLRQFIANIQNLFSTFMMFMQSLATFAGSFATTFIMALNIIMPIVNSVMNVLAGAIQTITGSAGALRLLTAVLVVCASAWAMFRVQALAATAVAALAKVLYAVASAVLFLSAALMRSPIVLALILITTGLVGIAAASKKADNAISSFFNKLSGLNGSEAGDVLQDTGGGMSDAANAADQFSDRMDSVADSADAAADAVGGAGGAAKKAAKDAKGAAAGLLSFDEVFKLNEKADASAGGGGGSGGLGDLEGMLDGLDALGGGIGDALIPEIPDFSEFATNFISALKDSILAKLAIAGGGALLAKKILDWIKVPANVAEWKPKALSIVKALGKAILGASIGIAFDAFASLLTDKIWKALEGALRLDSGSAGQADFGATLGSMIGGAIGMVIGGIPGSLIGAAIGHLAGGIVGLMWDELSGAISNVFVGLGAGITGAIAKSFGANISTVLGTFVTTGSFTGFFSSLSQVFKAAGLKAIAKGGILGMVVGFITDGIAALLWNTLSEKLGLGPASKETAKIGQTIGSILGAVIGGILGGPVGALIGSAVGTFAAGFVGLFWGKITEAFKPVTDWVSGITTNISNGLQSWWSYTVGLFGTWSAETIVGFSTWWSDTWKGFSTWWDDTTSGFSTWWSDTKSGLSSWWKDTIATFSDWDSITGDTLSEWWSSTATGFNDWFTDTISGFTNWFTDTFEGVSNWYKSTVDRFNVWKTGTIGTISSWISTTKNQFTSWVYNVIGSIGAWASDTYNRIAAWASDTYKEFQSFVSGVLGVVGGFALSIVKAFTDWCSDVYSELQSWFKGLITSIKTWWNSLWNYSNWTSGWSHVSGWFSTFYNKIYNWFSSLRSAVSTWWDNLWSDKKVNASFSSSGTSAKASLKGYATGGIVNREQVARIAEGNRAEAVIPLENASAMQPFVNAISQGILEGLAPAMLSSSGSSSGGNDLPPMYVGTLIADERGLKQLYKKFEIIRVQENARTGLAL